MSGYGSKDWANKSLSWFLKEILYSDTWKEFPYYKIVVGEVIAQDLLSHGYWWQARNLRHHVNRWKRKQKVDVQVRVSCKTEGFDTLSIEREREVQT